MSDTKIEWATKVLNPVRGCNKVSEGCRNCYAIKQAHRFHGEGMPFEGLTEKTAAGLNWTGKLILVPIAQSRKEIKKWKEPQRVFVNSMSDLFHEDVPNNFLDELFNLLTEFQQHTFMILTKRPKRMKEFMDWYFETNKDPFDENDKPYIAPNIWLGISVENQKAADERIPLLLQTPADIRFLSCEPLLGPVDIYQIPSPIDGQPFEPLISIPGEFSGIDWIIVGGESGHGARPMHPEWARSLRDQCQAAGASFFFKQWGEFEPDNEGDWWVFPNGQSNHLVSKHLSCPDATVMKRVGKKAAGRLLDGREWNEFPEVRT